MLQSVAPQANFAPHREHRLAGQRLAVLAASPMAQKEAKDLIRAVAHRPLTSEVVQDTADRIAKIRSSPEGREGVAAFLEKRRAAWVPPDPQPEIPPDLPAAGE